VRTERAAHPLCENETNYCPRCQTGGKLLADRALSRFAEERLAEEHRELEKL